MAAVGAVNLIIQRGTYFEETFSLAAEDGGILNLSGSSAVARLKKHPKAETYYQFSPTISVAESTVKISMASTITQALPSGRCVYDIVLTSSSGLKSKVVEGNVIVQESVSV